MDCIVLFSQEEKRGDGGKERGKKEGKNELRREREREEVEWCGAAVKDMAAKRWPKRLC